MGKAPDSVSSYCLWKNTSDKYWVTNKHKLEYSLLDNVRDIHLVLGILINISYHLNDYSDIDDALTLYQPYVPIIKTIIIIWTYTA
jgi:hypothetical protein